MVGRRVHQYEILEQLGQGGMGVVFKARDTRLGRLVALKFLPQSLADEPVAMERLRREARAASSLNHPHICTLHDIGEADGRPFIVMELLEGETLRRRLSAGGALPPDQIVELGQQLADALDAAHARGILHRDIKPENIFLTSRGDAKLMDFGLAKLAPDQGGPAPGSASPTVSMPLEALTRPGVAMGTVAYMSPEQARGLVLDARSDLFSFGAVLYEMATGRMAFPGATSAVVFEAILNRPPRPAREVNDQVPERLEPILEKALEKDRDLRYQSAADLRTDLKRLKRATEDRSTPFPVAGRPGPPSPPGLLRRSSFLFGGLALGIAVAAALFVLRARTVSPVDAVEGTRELKERQLTGFGSEERVISARLSPDGRMLALVTPRGLFIQLVATGATQPVPIPEGFLARLWSADWFPDGSSLALTATDPDEPRKGYCLFAVSMLGGTPRRIQVDARYAQVSPDGAHVAFYGQEGLQVADVDGTNRRTLVEGVSDQDGSVGSTWSPDGRSILFTRAPESGSTDATLEDIDLDGGSPVTLASIPHSDWAQVAWARDGRIFYLASNASEGDTDLWELRAEPRTRRILGAPRRLTHLVGAMSAELSLSEDAKRMAILRVNLVDDVWIGDLAQGGRALEKVRRLDLDHRFLHFPIAWRSEDEAVLFATVRNQELEFTARPLGQARVEVLASGIKIQAGQVEWAVATPDGSWLLYDAPLPGAHAQGEPSRALMKLHRPRGSPEVLLRMEEGSMFDCGTRPGSGCIVGEPDGSRTSIFRLDPGTGRGGKLCTIDPAKPGRLSPDGRRLALPDGSKGIRIVSLAGGIEEKVAVPGATSGIKEVAWSADGRGVFLLEGYAVRYTDLLGKASVLLQNPRELWACCAFPSADGAHLAFGGHSWDNNVWLLEGF